MAAVVAEAGAKDERRVLLESQCGSIEKLLLMLQKFFEGNRNEKKKDKDAGRKGMAKTYLALRKHAIAAAEKIEHESTKFSLLLGNAKAGDTKMEAVETLCAALMAPCDTLVSCVAAAGSCGCTQDLAQCLLQETRTVLEAVRRLLVEAGKAQVKELAVFCGQVWSACKNFKRLPQSNRSCAKRVIMKAFIAVRDVTNDVAQDLEAIQNGEALGDFLDFGDEDDTEGTEPSEEELEEWRKALPVLRACQGLLRVAKETIDFVPAEAARVSLLEDATESCRHLESCTVEAGVTLLHPQKSENVGESMAELKHAASTYAGKILELLHAAVPEDDDGHRARQQLETKMESCSEYFHIE